MSHPRVILQPRRARQFSGRHPWVFAGAIMAVSGKPADGDVVDLHSHTGSFVARGIYNSRSKIRVRQYSWSPDIALDRDFFRARLEAARHLRGPILGLDRPGGACRLVFSEGDGLSGLTIDRYDRWLVVQFTALGMAMRREMWVELLVEMFHPEGIQLRTERGIGQLEGLELHDGVLWGSPPAGPIEIEQGGLHFLVNLAEGHKTGFYLDQRDNRPAVAALAAGRKVLDAFSYTGGFGLEAARAGASAVISVDSSAAALELARANAQRNGLADRITYAEADVFDDLQRRGSERERFSMVILDPPRFARRQSAVEEALRGYHRLQTLALRLLEPDGILVTCCCSGLITMSILEDLLAQLAVEENREIQVLERRGQPADHPVAVTCPESNYLKCLICRVR